MSDWWPSKGESSLRKGVWASRIGGRRPLLGPLHAEDFDLERFRSVMRPGGSVLGLQFVGHPPNVPVLPIRVQQSDIEFPVATIGWVPIPPGGYRIALIRGGSTHAAGLKVSPGEICCLEYYFGAVGITFSYWERLTALTLREFDHLQRMPTPTHNQSAVSVQTLADHFNSPPS